MGKKVFILIVGLMSISLVGIITVQVFWINDAIDSKNEQFINDVQKSLRATSNRINDKIDFFYEKKVENIIENMGQANNAQIRNYLFQEIDTINNEKITFGTTFLEENFKIPTAFLNNDSIIYKRITGKKDVFSSKSITGIDDENTILDEKRFSTTERFYDLEMEFFASAIEDVLSRKPIHRRISNRELQNILKEELEKRDILLDFKYGVYSKDGLGTKLKSGYYTLKKKGSQQYPLFRNSKGEVDYKLVITFPTQKKHILSSLSNILLLSLLFIVIIIVAFSSSLYQLVRSKKISEIKTDFINNMTHEFKTPIATINLALDSIKNPKILDDREKVLRYVGMIKEENKRMHAQVESVLRISKLDKNQVEIPKEAVDGEEIINDAIGHLNLLVADRNGSVAIHFEALTSEIIGNKFHLTNVFVNILENAVKYSMEPPKIDIYTGNTNKNLIIKIKDEGIGMGKNAQKYVFNKFYREYKGDVHNVKGHGLGLAYVKKIIDNHQGTVVVVSEKGKGSTFTVKLPLI